MKRLYIIPLYSRRYLVKSIEFFHETIENNDILIKLVKSSDLSESLSPLMEEDYIQKLPIHQFNNESHISEPLDAYLIVIINTESKETNPMLDSFSTSILKSVLNSFVIQTSGMYMFEHIYIKVYGENLVSEYHTNGGSYHHNFMENYIKYTPHTTFYEFSLNRDSKVSKTIEFDVLFNSFLVLDKLADSPYKKIVELGIDYYIDSFSQSDDKKAFLSLSIILELIFNSNQNEKIHLAIKRLSSLVSLTKSEKSKITNELSEIARIRNKIAHGSVDLNDKEIKENYSCFYDYIRTSLIIILCEFQNIFDVNQDYYSELNIFIEDRFNRLNIR